MAARRAGFVPYLLNGAFHRLAYTEYGERGAPPVVCVHGLTRVGADFDVMAAALADDFHLILADLPGRGRSDWLDDPALYTAPSYVAALAHLMAGLGDAVDFVGTSLGGICGMGMASIPGHRIRRLVLNDVGPFVPGEAMDRLRAYLSAPPPRFANVAMLKTYLRRVHAPFGPLTNAQWLTLAENSARPLPDGGVALHYDPAIAVAFAAAPPGPLDMWEWWNKVDAPMLVLRGEWSDLLPEDLLDSMRPKACIHTVERAGHAPALLDAPTIEVVRRFLAG